MGQLCCDLCKNEIIPSEGFFHCDTCQEDYCSDCNKKREEKENVNVDDQNRGIAEEMRVKLNELKKEYKKENIYIYQCLGEDGCSGLMMMHEEKCPHCNCDN